MGVPHLYSLQGRIGRREFIATQLCVLICSYFATFLLIVISSAGYAGLTGLRGIWEAIIGTVVWLAVAQALWISMAAAVKRCHDRGLSGTMLMFAMPPVIGQLWLVLSLVAGQGQPDDNRYGAAPRSPDLSRGPALA
jgi:uncharacterized membrane protein YhaH (DUF805 family)